MCNREILEDAYSDQNIADAAAVAARLGMDFYTLDATEHFRRYVVEDFIVCGTRGWFNDEKQQVVVGTVDYAKIVNREVGRLRLSLEQAKKLQDPYAVRETLVFLHFPPVFGGFECREMIDVLHEYGIRRCFYGHIHSSYRIPRSVDYEGIELTLASSDFLNFVPMMIFPE